MYRGKFVDGKYLRRFLYVAYDNGFKTQWEQFIRHVVAGTPWKADLLEAAKGVQLAELGLRSWAERRWIDVPALSIEEAA